MKRTAPYLLLLALAAAVGCLVLLIPNPGTRHTDRPAPIDTADRPADPIARPATPVPATAALPADSQPPTGTDAGLITTPAPHVIALPGGVTPVPEAPRPVDSPVDVDPVPEPDPASICLAGTCPPVADDSGLGQLSCGDGQQWQGELGCVAVQLPDETQGRAIDSLPDCTTD
jgi:hypothetical protein